MTNEIVVNDRLAGVLKDHGVSIQIDNEFVTTDLANNAKFKARAVYQEVNDSINSRLDIMVETGKGYSIVESFGDVGATVEDAINKNFQNFSRGSLHPLLAAFGSADPETLRQVEVEEWVINERRWKAYLGNLVPKAIGAAERIIPPVQFFQSIEQGIRAQQLSNELHWFRSYYCQWNEKITEKEFLMDNEVMDANMILGKLPILPDVQFYSCRNFIVLVKVGHR
jgi:hypothetical protein